MTKTQSVILMSREVRKRAAVDESIDHFCNMLITADDQTRVNMDNLALEFTTRVDRLGMVGAVELLNKLSLYLAQLPMPVEKKS